MSASNTANEDFSMMIIIVSLVETFPSRTKCRAVAGASAVTRSVIAQLLYLQEVGK